MNKVPGISIGCPVSLDTNDVLLYFTYKYVVICALMFFKWMGELK